jgi:hypothetical protein
MLETGKLDVASFEAAPASEAVALARKISWTPMDNAGFPSVFPARLVVTTTDGRTLNAELSNVRGAPGRPVQDPMVDAKFAANATRRLQSDNAATLLTALRTIDAAPDLSILSKALRYH